MTRREGGRRLLPEVIFTLLVLASLAWVVNRFIVDGKLPQPFVFDINDTFMDWFNTAYYAHNRGAYDTWQSVYPPLSFVFMRAFGIPACYANNPANARDCDVVGISTILLCYLIA